jgi:hypothetical protein
MQKQKNVITLFFIVIMMLVNPMLHAAFNISWDGTPPTQVSNGQKVTIMIFYTTTQTSIVQVRLNNSAGESQGYSYFTVPPGNNVWKEFTVTVTGTASSNNYWLGQLMDTNWQNLSPQLEVPNVKISNSESGEGVKTLIFEDNFDSGATKVLPDSSKWFPQLGNASWEYEHNTEKPLRWSDGNNAETAWMYSCRADLSSTKSQYYYKQDGNLVLQAICHKNDTNEHGAKVKCGYLMTGYPSGGDNPDGKPKYSGHFFNPQNGKIEIECKIKTIDVKGASTWFAFWAFNENYAYNGNSIDGTELDFFELPKGTGEGSWLNNTFNVANHWLKSDGSESKSFNSTTTPSVPELCQNLDGDWHTWKVVWTEDQVECFVDGKWYYTINQHIPSNPTQMMLLLTLEFKLNQWSGNAGDGRVVGNYVSDNSDYRIMSRVYIDYIKVWQWQ